MDALSPFYLFMASSAPEGGWRQGMYYITSGTEPCQPGDFCNQLGEPLVHNGTLTDESETGVDDICLADGCYRLDVLPGNSPERIFWVFCGANGRGGVEMIFSIKEGMCVPHVSMFECTVSSCPYVQLYIKIL